MPHLLPTAGAILSLLELMEGLAAIVGRVEHGGVLAEHPLLGDKRVQGGIVILIIIYVQSS